MKKVDPFFIVLEGLDGAGTTTQTARLEEWLRALGLTVVVTREPSDGPIGRLIREMLRNRHGDVDPSAIALLFAADRVDHLAREIHPNLSAGNIVISDRYLMSSLAYQGRDGNLPWVEILNQRADTPDLTILLDVDLEVCLSRLASRGSEAELYERRETLEAVCAAYRRLVDEEKISGALAVVDGSVEVEQVFEAIKRVVKKRFNL